MKITIISHNYYPEDSGIGLYSTGMAEYLATNHDVTVVTGVPYYPQWEIYPQYKEQPQFSNETINNVKVYRFKQYTPRKPTFLKRVIQMLHFFIGSLITLFKVKKTAIVIVVLPFTTSVVLGWLCKIFQGATLWVHIQDFEFDAAFKSKMTSKKQVVAKILFDIERGVLNRADCISTISHGMMDKLAKKTKVNQVYFPNWIDHSLIDPKVAPACKLFDTNKFTILYSGNIGEKQDWEFYIAFVKALENHPEIHFYLVGEGARKIAVVNALEKLNNFTHHPPVAYKDLNELLCNADIHLLFQKPDFKDLVMPSKILGMMASAKPSLVTGNKDSEIKTSFEQSQGGYYFYENDIQAIMDKILFLKEHPEIAQETGAKARKYVLDHFSIEKILEQFEKDLIRTKER